MLCGVRCGVISIIIPCIARYKVRCAMCHKAWCANCYVYVVLGVRKRGCYVYAVLCVTKRIVLYVYVVLCEAKRVVLRCAT